jgi:hypothetical protein
VALLHLDNNAPELKGLVQTTVIGNVQHDWHSKLCTDVPAQMFHVQKHTVVTNHALLKNSRLKVF